MSVFWVLFFLIVGPGIYFYGWISVVRHIFGKKPPADTNITRSIPPTLQPHPASPTPIPPKSLMTQPRPSLWQAWYSDNSINLLLYIGAFLIISAALAFVGFQWGYITGYTKAIIFSFITFAFLISGLIFQRRPVVEAAGATFTAIGALLIPILGSAWYIFVLRDFGVSHRETWMYTSLVSLGIYLTLGRTYPNRFYAYLAGLATYVFSFSILGTLELGTQYALIFAVFPAFFTLWSTRIPTTRYLTPAINHITNLALAYSLLLSLSHTNLYSLPVTTGLIATTIYYLLYYSLNQSYVHLAVTLILTSFTTFFATGYFHRYLLHFPESNMATNQHLILVLLALCFMGAAGYFHQLKNYLQESRLNLIASLVVALFTLYFSFLYDLHHIQAHLSVLVLMGVGIIAYWLLRIPEVLLLSSLAPIISSFLITYDLSTHAHRFEILGLVFSFTGLVGYLLFRFIPRSFRSTLTITTLVYFLFALSLTLNSGYYLAFILFLIGLILHHAPRIFPFKELPYLATAALAWSLRVFIHESHLSLVYLPHFWLFLGALTYALHTLPQIKLPVHYRRAGLLMTLLTPIIVSPSLFASQSLIHPAVSSYLASLLFTLDYSLYRRPLALYFSGGLAIFGWFLHGHYLHLTDFLIYTLPLGVYFTAIGYHRLLEKDHTNYQNVTFLGALTIFFPSFVAAFGSEAGKHAIVMFTIGCAYLGAGITLPQRFYRLIGVTGIVLAVLPQTYTYLLHLPRWITLALLGILFISGALYLLLKRQHPKILG